MHAFTARIWQQRIYLIDLWRGRVEWPDLERKCYELARFHKAQTLLIEDRASGQQLIQSLRDNRPAGVPQPISRNPTQDKVTRTVGISSMVESGQVYTPVGAHWVDCFSSEVAAFPQGKNDDQIDALTQLLDWGRGRLNRPRSEIAGPVLFYRDYEDGPLQWCGDFTNKPHMSFLEAWA